MSQSVPRPTQSVAPVVRQALDATAIGEPPPVFDLCDRNLANYLREGRVIDVAGRVECRKMPIITASAYKFSGMLRRGPC